LDEIDITELEPESTFDDPNSLDDAVDDIDDENAVDDLAATLMELKEAGIELVIEERPVIAKRSVKAPVLPWEEYLALLTDAPGKTVRLFVYHGEEGRAKARRRAHEILKRLESANPQECWSVTWDYVKEDESWRVYVSYERDYTETELAEKSVKKLAAQDRARHAAATRKATIDAAKA